MVSSEGVKESVNQYPFHNHVAVTPPLDQRNLRTETLLSAWSALLLHRVCFSFMEQVMAYAAIEC
jgi:hypothetical protein